MVTLESVTISVMGAVLGLVLGVVIGVLLQRSLRDDLSELALPLSSLAVFLLVAVRLRRGRRDPAGRPRLPDERARGDRDRVGRPAGFHRPAEHGLRDGR